MNPGELVDRVERLRHLGLAGHVQELGVAGDRVDHLLGIASLLQLLDRVAWVASLQVRVALVVEVVDEPP